MTTQALQPGQSIYSLFPGLNPIDGALFPVGEADQKRAQAMGILQAGLGILGNSRGRSFGEALGAGGMLGFQGYQNQMQQLQQNQMMQGMRAAQLMKMKSDQEEVERKRAQQADIDKMIAGLPPEQQMYARMNPQAFIQRQIDMTMPKPKEAPWEAGGMTPEQYRNFQKQGAVPFSMQGMTPEQARDFEMGKARAGAPSTVNKINVETGKSLAGKVGDIADTALTEARSAVQQMQNNNRVLEALSSGKVMAGPGTTIRQTALQVGSLLGVGGKDAQETLVNTRKVVQGLAESTLASRGMLKGQGQVTEYEQKTLEKARSGNIDDMTIPELQTVFQVANRLAQEQYGRAGASLQEIQSNPEYRQIAPFYRAPELPQPYTGPAPAPAPQPARSRDAVLRQYGVK